MLFSFLIIKSDITTHSKLLAARILQTHRETKSKNSSSAEAFRANESDCKGKTLYHMKQIFGKKYFKKVNFNLIFPTCSHSQMVS